MLVRTNAPILAAAIYVAAWIVGLAIWPSNPSVSASGADVVRTYGAHQAVAVVQFLLVEGIAAIALAAVVLALAQAVGRAGRAVLATGLTACLISVTQCVLGVVLAAWLAAPAHVGAAADVFEAINRLDGVKMFLLAALIATAVRARRELGSPSWWTGVGLLAILALVVSGIGYLVLDDALAAAAFASLPLLLVWVAATAAILSRPGERHSAAPAIAGSVRR